MPVTPKEAKERYDALESKKLTELAKEFEEFIEKIDEALINSAGQGANFDEIDGKYLEVAKKVYGPSWFISTYQIEVGHQRDPYKVDRLRFRPNEDPRVEGTLNYSEPTSDRG